MTTIPKDNVQAVRLRAPALEALQFNQGNVAVLLERGWLKSFEISASGELTGWLRPNDSSPGRRSRVGGDDVVVCEVDSGRLLAVDPKVFAEECERVPTLSVDASGSTTTTCDMVVITNLNSSAGDQPRETSSVEGTTA